MQDFDYTALIADDDPATRRLFRRVLEQDRAKVVTVSDGRGVLDQARSRPFDVVLLDLEMPGLDGLGALRQLRAFDPDIPVLMISGVATVPISVQATRLGAFDFLEKPVDPGQLTRLVRHAVRQQRLKIAARAASDVDAEDSCLRILGQSSQVRRMKQQIRRIARYDVPVLVTGESGVGKELCAEALHEASPRAKGPFVAFNAAAVPDTLFESTVFGHVRGAFTGANRDQQGLMVSAQGGTLVLDEVGDLSLGNQVKLLRALETRQVLAVGATQPRPVDIRVIACTNADLSDRVVAGDFRADLYYRLRGVSLPVPALRERRGDVAFLANHFLGVARKRFDIDVSGFEPDVLAALEAHVWPGNVRELMHTVMSAALMASTPWITAADLPTDLRPQLPSKTPDTDHSLTTAERRHVQRVLRLAGANRSRAAEMLGVSRSTLYRLLARHSIDPESPT